MGQHCHPYMADIVCDQRKDAELHCTFWWESTVQGWVWSEMAERSVSWRTRYFNPQTPEPPKYYRLERCPFCSMPLAKLLTVMGDATCSGDDDGG